MPKARNYRTRTRVNRSN